MATGYHRRRPACHHRVMGQLLALPRHWGRLHPIAIWHALSKTSGRSLTSRAWPNDDGGDRHPSDYVVDLLEKINEGSGSVGSSKVILQLSIEEKEPLEQFYDYQHQF